ncbi:MAG TPA: F0F1 ATP synthase subunit delta, partial [Gemmatimonadaceae bacterium]
MNESTIGRNYAEALQALARKNGDTEEWGELLNGIANAMREDHTLRTFLESPKLSASHKIEILEKALGRKVPRLFLRYIDT